ncbi:MAG: hypothetical protein KH202_08330 [Clostridiales bacterium]|nr:hypothetical protein [Clostridiales bacterium]
MAETVSPEDEQDEKRNVSNRTTGRKGAFRTAIPLSQQNKKIPAGKIGIPNQGTTCPGCFQHTFFDRISQSS